MKLTEAQVKSLPERFKKERLADIAEEYGCSVRTLNYWLFKLRKAGVEVIRRKGPFPLKLN